MYRDGTECTESTWPGELPSGRSARVVRTTYLLGAPVSPPEMAVKLRNQRIYSFVTSAITIGLLAGIMKYADGGTTLLSAIMFAAGGFGSSIIVGGVVLVPMGWFTTPTLDAPPTTPPPGA